jgi:hypothetical protein
MREMSSTSPSGVCALLLMNDNCESDESKITRALERARQTTESSGVTSLNDTIGFLESAATVHTS